MRTLIVPDMHNRVDKVVRLITEIPHDRIVFLGDYFDDFHDTEHIAEKAAKLVCVPQRVLNVSWKQSSKATQD